jgi:hypothetical protein
MTAGVSVTSMGNGAPVVRWKGGRKWTHARKLHTGVAFSKLEPSRSCCTYASESFSGSPSGSTDFSFQILTGNINELRAPVKSQISAHLNGMSWSMDSVQKWNRTPTPLLDAKDHHIPKLELFVEGCFHTRTHIVIQTSIIHWIMNSGRKKNCSKRNKCSWAGKASCDETCPSEFESTTQHLYSFFFIARFSGHYSLSGRRRTPW